MVNKLLVSTVCERKSRSSEPTHNDEIKDENVYIVDECLTYMSHHFHNSSGESTGIKKAVCDFYLANEMTDAKRKLWNKARAVLPAYEQRRSTATRAAHEAEVGDILFALERIDKSDCDLPIFYAADLDRVPKYGPEELDVASLVQLMADFERTLQVLTATVNVHDKNLKSLTDTKLYSNVVSGQQPHCCHTASQQF